MSIEYISDKELFHIKTKNSSYIFRLRKGYELEHLYYGERINDTRGIEFLSDDNFLGATLHAIDSEFTEEKLSTDRMLREYPFYGSVDLRCPAFHAEYRDGSRVTKMKYLGHKIFSGKPELDGLPSVYAKSDEAQTLEITMADSFTGLNLIYRYSAFEELDVITRSVTAVNTGNSEITLDKIMSCSVDFDNSDFDFVHLHGEAWRECEIERKPLVNGEVRISSARGASSHLHSPFFALANKNTTEFEGEVFAFSLVYSGNFELGAEVDSLKNTRAYMGINSFDFKWLLESGQSFTTPEAVMVHSSNGFGEMSRTFHNLYRNNLARGKYQNAVRPILINNWEATYFDFNEEKILNLASKAKELGIELLVLDDGWFGKRNDDTLSLGDWYTNTDKLPEGIASLAKKVTEIGIKFGLWFEPEMVSPNSELYHKHPDWCIHIEVREKSLGRNQLVLDLSRKEVCDYIVSSVSDILSCGNISYIKWDMNRNFTEIGSSALPPKRQSEVAHRYILGLYNVLERIKTAFPDVLMEGCASGGGRFDAGMMYYFNQFWTSDNTDAIDRLKIQYGTSMVMPSMFMGAHVSAVPNHQTGRTIPLETRGLCAMCGQFGYELDITQISDDEADEIKNQIELYKNIREVIQFGDLYRLKSPFDGEKTFFEFVSKDKARVCLFYFTHSCAVQCNTEKIKLKGLKPDSAYKCNKQIYSAEFLERFGFDTENLQDNSGKVYLFEIQ
ncbi:MAG: alpha-galactosidase [Monoglobaceae bacterium]